MKGKLLDNFSLVNDCSFNCFDTVISSLANWFGYSYELAFMNTWGFSYRGYKSNFGNSLKSHRGDIAKPLYFYYGLKLIPHHIEATEGLEIIEKEIGHKRPVALDTDIYWCPWNRRYKKINDEHSTIIVGIDMGKKVLYCMDKPSWSETKNLVELSFDDYKMGIKSLRTIVFEAPKLAQDWRGIILESVMCMASKENHQFVYFMKNYKLGRKLLEFKWRSKRITDNVFDEMNAFANKISTIKNLESEKQGDLDVMELPIVEELSEIACCRRKYSMTLKHLSEKYSIKALEEISKNMNTIGWIWEEAKYHICENLSSSGQINNLKKSSDIIKDIVTLEKCTANSLIELL